MRVNRMGAQGTAELFAQAINDPEQGKLVYLLPGPANPTGQLRARPLYCILEAPKAEEIRRLNMEGSYNVSDGAAYIATFPGGTCVQTNDRFWYNGFIYKLLDAYTQPLGDAILGIRCLVQRTGPGGPPPF